MMLESVDMLPLQKQTCGCRPCLTPVDVVNIRVNPFLYDLLKISDVNPFI